MIRIIKFTTLLSLIMSTQTARAGHYETQDLEQAYAYLNQLRKGTGMVLFSPNHQLERAALNHANYLVDHLETGHYETLGEFGFTGVEPKDRALYAGYQSLMVSENVSSGESTSVEAIDALMSAIYHRMSFLDFVNNEVGIGIGQASPPTSYNAYVFNMGNSEHNTLCQGPAFSGIGQYYTGICSPDVGISTSIYNATTIAAQNHNPPIVIWPIEGDQNISPAFFEESPDPLPDYSVSGYPVSIHFNPSMFKKIKLLEFELYREQDDTKVTPVRLFTQYTDPHQLFTEFEFALFPLKRLDWDTSYRVEVEYLHDDQEQKLVWHFKTQQPGAPWFTIKGYNEILEVPSNVTFAVYIPPTTEIPKIEEIQYQFEQGMNIETSFKDGNTILITLSGQDNQEARFSFYGKKFTVKINAHALLPTSSSKTFLELSSLGKTQAVNKQGRNISTQTKFYGGVSVEQKIYQIEVVQTLAESVNIQGKINVDPTHIGEVVDLFVYARTTIPSGQYYFMLTENSESFFWDHTPEHLLAFSQGVRLEDTQQVTIYKGRFYYPGILDIFFGYRLNNGTMVTSGEPIKITINE